MKKNFTAICFAVLLLGNSCTPSTKIISSWKEPDKAVITGKLNKVLVVALFKSETSRHIAEDKMAAYLKNKGVVSYNYLDAAISVKNENAIRDKIKMDGFDGAVTMRLVDVDKEQKYTPGNIPSYPSYYRNFSGYYYRNWSYFNTPGYYTTTKTYTVETNVFSIKEDKIIWSGITKSVDPEGVDRMTTEIVKVIFKKMIKEGFVSK